MLRAIVYGVFFVAGLTTAAVTGVQQNRPSPVVNSTTCNGETYIYEQLAGFGSLPSNARDKFGDTLRGLGSSIAIDRNTWIKTPFGYTGILYALPDRGWNTQGTLNYQGRVHKFAITLTPKPAATVAKPSGPNIKLVYVDTILFVGPDRQPTTGLDGDPSGHLSFPGYPDLPIASFTGDGFGGSGRGGKLIPVDDEGFVLAHDGSFWVSDECGPYVYHYSQSGQMIDAIRPPNALIPMRNGSESPAKYIASYVIKLPVYPAGAKPSAAGASEIHYISSTQLLVLARDSGAGRGQSSTESVYRHADVIDISAATNIANTPFDGTTPVAPKGVLAPGVTPVEYCPSLDYNVNAQLERFGVHNGGAQDDGLLDEKWESLALVPVNPGAAVSGRPDPKGEYFLFSFSDNDFIMQDGYQNFGRFRYQDASGFDVETQVLAFQVRLPAGSRPI